jgi:hypothetical protein
MALSQLDVVNECLAGLGELPVNSVEDGHPLIPPAIRALALANTREQGKSWWFNRELVELSPDTSGNIYVPNDALSVDGVDRRRNVVMRGRRLYQPFERNLADKYSFTKNVVCWLVREVPFEDLPSNVQLMVSLSAQYNYLKSYDADPQKVGLIRNSLLEAMRTVNTEHIRNEQANLLDPVRVQSPVRTSAGWDIDYTATPYNPHP